MFGGLGDFFNGITEGITKIFEFLISLPTKIADALKFLFDLVVDAVKNIASGIWSFFKDPIGSIGNFLGSILDVISGLGQFIIDGILSVLKFVFIPRDDFFSDKFNDLNNLLEKKIKTESYVELLESLQYVKKARDGLPPLTVTIMGHTSTIVDFSFYSKYQSTIYGWVRGFVFIFIIFYNFNNVYKLIRGGSLSSANGVLQNMGGNREGGS